MFYHQYALSRLKAERYKLAVCSNSVRKSVEVMMEKSNLGEYAEFLLSNQDVTHPKPHPEMYVKAIRKLGVSPKECLIVEDNENGVKATLKARAHLLRVYSVEEVNYQNIKAKIREIEGD